MDAHQRQRVPLAAFACDGVGGLFFWRFCVQPDHIGAAVEALMSALKCGPGRLWNPHTEAYTRATFKKRIERAVRGKLKPPDEVKQVAGRIPEVKLFEIRWSGLHTQIKDSKTGRLATISLEARLYYVEPTQFGRVILGLHCHEKQVDGGEQAIREAQDCEIEKALECYAQGMPNHWGIDELAPM